MLFEPGLECNAIPCRPAVFGLASDVRMTPLWGGASRGGTGFVPGMFEKLLMTIYGWMFGLLPEIMTFAKFTLFPCKV